jgi:hypothetical protein
MMRSPVQVRVGATGLTKIGFLVFRLFSSLFFSLRRIPALLAAIVAKTCGGDVGLRVEIKSIGASVDEKEFIILHSTEIMD